MPCVIWSLVCVKSQGGQESLTGTPNNFLLTKCFLPPHRFASLTPNRMHFRSYSVLSLVVFFFSLYIPQDLFGKSFAKHPNLIGVCPPLLDLAFRGSLPPPPLLIICAPLLRGEFVILRGIPLPSVIPLPFPRFR